MVCFNEKENDGKNGCMILKLKWKDKSGKDCSKTYTIYEDAIKARNWLVKMGATDIDMSNINILGNGGLQLLSMSANIISRVRV